MVRHGELTVAHLVAVVGQLRLAAADFFLWCMWSVDVCASLEIKDNIGNLKAL